MKDLKHNKLFLNYIKIKNKIQVDILIIMIFMMMKMIMILKKIPILIDY